MVNVFWRSAKLLWREWEGKHVVFNLNSGNTHFLSSTAVEVLRLLEKEELSVGAISDSLISKIGVSSDKEIISKVEGLLKNLDHMGLVESVTR